MGQTVYNPAGQLLRDCPMIELLRCLARGSSNEQIGDTLHISEATVRTHVSHILSKLGLTNRTQAALYALREGIATLHNGTE